MEAVPVFTCVHMFVKGGISNSGKEWFIQYLEQLAIDFKKLDSFVKKIQIPLFTIKNKSQLIIELNLKTYQKVLRKYVKNFC